MENNGEITDFKLSLRPKNKHGSGQGPLSNSMDLGSGSTTFRLAHLKQHDVTFDEMARRELLGHVYISYKLQNISHFLVIAFPMWLCWSSIWGANISKIRNILEFVCSVDAAFMSALHDDLTHDWTNHRDMIIFKTVFRKFYLGAPPLPAKLISYLKTVCVTWHYANSQSCGIVRYLYYIRLMGSQMQPKRPATWVKYSKKSGCEWSISQRWSDAICRRFFSA